MFSCTQSNDNLLGWIKIIKVHGFKYREYQKNWEKPYLNDLVGEEDKLYDPVTFTDT